MERLFDDTRADPHIAGIIQDLIDCDAHFRSFEMLTEHIRHMHTMKMKSEKAEKRMVLTYLSNPHRRLLRRSLVPGHLDEIDTLFDRARSDRRILMQLNRIEQSKEQFTTFAHLVDRVVELNGSMAEQKRELLEGLRGTTIFENGKVKPSELSHHDVNKVWSVARSKQSTIIYLKMFELSNK